MNNFEIDANGVYVNNEKVNVFYHDKFNDICFNVEDTNFWFNNRNDILGNVINNFSKECIFQDPY